MLSLTFKDVVDDPITVKMPTLIVLIHISFLFKLFSFLFIFKLIGNVYLTT